MGTRGHLGWLLQQGKASRDDDSGQPQLCLLQPSRLSPLRHPALLTGTQFREPTLWQGQEAPIDEAKPALQLKNEKLERRLTPWFILIVDKESMRRNDLCESCAKTYGANDPTGFTGFSLAPLLQQLDKRDNPDAE